MPEGLTGKVKVSGVNETIRAFRDLPKDASNELRDRTKTVASELAGKIATAARASSGQSALVAGTVKAVRDRTPMVTAGGAKRVGRNKKPADKILFGANFGASRYKQFRPHRGAGSDDYWFFRTIEANQASIDAQWNEAADVVIANWGRGG